MKLLTKELEKRFEKIGRQETSEDPIVVCKFFHPASTWTWLATEYNPTDKTFFGLVIGFEEEWGYFSLEELEEINIAGLGIERDLYFEEQRLSELTAKGL